LQSLIGRATQSILQPRRSKQTSVRARHRHANSSTLWARLNARAEVASRIGVSLSIAFLLSVGVYGTVLGGHADEWRSTLSQRMDAALVASGFGISEVLVRGREHASAALIDEALGADEARTIFGFDTRAAQQRLEQLGWVKSARVMRLWPSTLVVELQEREAFARWRVRGHTLLIDRDGRLLGPVTSDFEGLPLVAGEGADKASARLMEHLGESGGLSKRVALAERIEQRRWDLVLSGGPRVQLPSQGVASALGLLEQLLRGRMPDNVQEVDMRVAGRITLRAKPAETTPAAQVSARITGPEAQRL